MLMALIGLLAPFLPDLLGLVRGYMDHKFEMEMMQLRMEQSRAEAQYRMEEIEIQGQVQEMLAARKPHESYGIQLLDKAQNSGGLVWRPVFNCIFIMFALLDWMISSVRPMITYWAFGLYTIVKSAALVYTYQASAKYSGGTVEALVKTFMNEAAFTPFDQDMLTLIISFWFGNRIRNGGRSALKSV